MNFEAPNPTELQPDLTKEQFVNFPEMKSMTEADGKEMADWLGVETEKFNPQTAEFLFFEMGKNQQDSAKGWGRLSVLIAARMIYHQGNPGGQETVGLEDRVRENLKTIKDDPDEILAEGFTSKEGTTTWYLAERPKTCLAETVKAVVDEWRLSDSEHAKLSAAELALDHRQQTINELKDRAGRLEKDLEIVAEERNEAKRSQNADSEEILLLKRELEERKAGGGEVWGDEQKREAQRQYDALEGDKERPMVDGLAKVLAESGVGNEWLGLIPELSLVYNAVGRGGSEVLSQWSQRHGLSLNESTLAALQTLLEIRPISKELEAAEANADFYRSLPQIVRLRTEQIAERQNTIESLNQRSVLGLEVSRGPKKGTQIRIDGAVSDLIAEAHGVSDYQLPQRRIKVKLDDSIAIAVKEINLVLKQSWQAGSGEFQHIIFNNAKGGALFSALSLLYEKGGYKLAEGYQISGADNKLLLKEGQSLIAEITLGKEGRIKVSWGENIGLERGLAAMAVFGQSLNDNLAKGERFPGLSLKLAGTKLEKKAPEPPPVERVEPAPPPSAEVPPSRLMADALELGELKAEREKMTVGRVEQPFAELDERQAGETAVTEEPAKIEGDAATAARPEVIEADKSDWLKALENASSQPAVEQAPAETVEMDATAPLLKPEAPKPVQVDSVEEIAGMIREKGVGEVQFGEDLLKDMVILTLERIRQTIDIPGVEIRGITVDDSGLIVNNGLIFSFTANGKYGVIPVSALVSCQLDSSFNLIGQPTFKLPKGPYDKEEAKADILNYIIRFRSELSETMIAELEKLSIDAGKIENPRIVGQNTLATFRGRKKSRLQAI